MKQLEKPNYRKLVVVCVRKRDCDACCASKGSLEIFDKLKATIKEADPTVRVSKTSCLGQCLTGVTVAIQPDNIWLGEVTEADIPKVVELAIK